MRAKRKIIAVAMAAVMSCTTLATTASAAWVTTDKGVVWENADGTQAKSKWMTMKSGKKYYIKSDGTRAVGLLTMKNKSGGKDYYYFDDSGVMQTGWQSVKGAVYYFGKDGKAAVKATIIGNYTYKFSVEGKWDGKVYSKDGKKDVTASVDVAKLVPVQIKEYGKVKTVEGEKPATVTINGLTYRTDVNNTFDANGKAQPVFPDGNKYTNSNINIAGCTDADLECLKYMSQLERLDLNPCTNEEMLLNGGDEYALTFACGCDNPAFITNLDFVYYMPNLKYVSIYNAPYLTDISGLSVCKNLESVTFVGCGIKNLDGLENVKTITNFSARYTRLESLSGLKNCKNLKMVEVMNAYLTDISGLSNKAKLTSVNLHTNRRLADIAALGTCKNLKYVTLYDCNSIMDWDSMLKLKKLKICNFVNASTKSNVKQVSETLLKNGVESVDFKYDYGKMAPHSIETIDVNVYWDYEMFSADIYGNGYPCTCSYCANWEKNKRGWLELTYATKSIKDLGTYKA